MCFLVFYLQNARIYYTITTRLLQKQPKMQQKRQKKAKKQG